MCYVIVLIASNFTGKVSIQSCIPLNAPQTNVWEARKTKETIDSRPRSDFPYGTYGGAPRFWGIITINTNGYMDGIKKPGRTQLTGYSIPIPDQIIVI